MKEDVRRREDELRRKANIRRVAAELNSKARDESVYNAMKEEVDRKVKEQRDKQRNKEKAQASQRAKNEEDAKNKREAEWARLQADRKKKAHEEQKRRAAEQAKKNQQQHRSWARAKAATNKTSQPPPKASSGPSASANKARGESPTKGTRPESPQKPPRGDQWDSFFNAWDSKAPPGESGPRPQQRSATTPRRVAPERQTSRAAADDSRWDRFESAANVCIEYKDVPYIQVGKQYFGPQYDKKSFQKLAMRWHPDKFMQKFGQRLAEKDKEKILLKVKEVFQLINSQRK